MRARSGRWRKDATFGSAARYALQPTMRQLPTIELTRLSPDYPPGLERLPRPPPRVWCRGLMPDGPAVAIVGSRRAGADALRFAQRLAADLSEAGLWTVSGGALGVDGAAHRGSVEAGRPTLVVQAAPLEQPYPPQNRPLFDAALAAGGGWLSETPPGQAPVRGRFLSRNRLIAALADVVVVVRAPQRSGALSTAQWATRLGRPLLAVPSAPWAIDNGGCLALLAGEARICRGPDDVWAALGRGAPHRAAPSPTPGNARAARGGPKAPDHQPPSPAGRRGKCRQEGSHRATDGGRAVGSLAAQLGEVAPPRSAPARSAPAALSPPARTLLDALSERPQHIDELVDRTGLCAPACQAALVELEMQGAATRSAHGFCRGFSAQEAAKAGGIG